MSSFLTFSASQTPLPPSTLCDDGLFSRVLPPPKKLLHRSAVASFLLVSPSFFSEATWRHFFIRLISPSSCLPTVTAPLPSYRQLFLRRDLKLSLPRLNFALPRESTRSSELPLQLARCSLLIAFMLYHPPFKASLMVSCSLPYKPPDLGLKSSLCHAAQPIHGFPAGPFSPMPLLNFFL